MISIGPEVISHNNSPEQIPIGGELDAVDKKLSDGSRILKITGYTPQDFTLTGTLVPWAGLDSAIKQFERLEQMAILHQPQIFTWTGNQIRRSFPVIVRGCTGQIQKNNEVAYTLTLFRATNSGLVAGGYVPSTAQRNSQYTKGLKNVRGRTSAGTQAAIDNSLSAQAAVRHAGS